MKIYVNVNAGHDGNGTEQMPFRHINDAAKIAQPGDEVWVAPGVYREYVDPVHAGREDARITYRSVEPLGAVITGAERIQSWVPYKENVWVCRVANSLFGNYNPYTTMVYGDWYFAKADKHTGCVYLNNRALYEAGSVEECIKAEVYECSWVPEESTYKWYTEQDQEKDETVIYANFHGADPNEENVEINVRRECFMPSKTGVGYITVSGFVVTKAATTWAPPAAYQDGMIGPHWSKGWIIEDCEISNSKCAGISLGKYYDPENDHYFTNKYVKSPTQMERDAVCRGQYHGWLKEKIGSHIIRRNNIHHCEQGGIIGRMGGVFSIIEDNHIHHINNMMELGGAEIAGIKMHAAIDVIMRRNHIHHCTMGIWCDWEAQGTRLSQNLLHDNQRPAFAKQLKGGMMCQDIFVEVGHGPTLIDNNILLSDASLRFATQGVAMVHNLICGALTCVGEGTSWRYTPYHMPHRTEVMGFMTILHGDDRFYNNIFVQKWPSEDFITMHDSDDGFDSENRKVGTWMFPDNKAFRKLRFARLLIPVNDDYKRHILYIQFTKCFCSQIFIGDQFGLFDAFCKKRTCTADSSEVYTIIFLHGVYYFRKAGTFSDHSSCSHRHHCGCIGIHTSAGCRARGADDCAWFCRSWSYIVDGCICRIKWNFLTFCKGLTHSLVSCIT